MDFNIDKKHTTWNFVLSMVANVPLLSSELFNMYLGNYPGSYNPMHGFYFLHFMRSKKMGLVHGHHQTVGTYNMKFMEKKVLIKTIGTTIIRSHYQTEDLATKAGENAPS